MYISGEELTNMIRTFNSDKANRKESVLYHDIEEAISSLYRADENFRYDFKKSNGKNSKLAIPFEVSNLMASYIALRRKYKTFTMVSRARNEFYNRSGMKNPQKPTDKNINNINISEVTEFTSDIYKFFSYFTDVEKEVFAHYLKIFQINNIFDRYDNIVMLEMQLIYFLKTVYGNYDSALEAEVTKLRLHIQNKTDYAKARMRKIKRQSEEENNYSFYITNFNNVFMQTYNCFASSINFILKSISSANEAVLNDNNGKKDYALFNNLSTYLRGGKLSSEREKSLFEQMKAIYDETIKEEMKKQGFNSHILYENVTKSIREIENKIEDEGVDSNVYYDACCYFDVLSKLLKSLINGEISVCMSKSETDWNKERKNKIIKIYRLTDKLCLSADIDELLDSFYDELSLIPLDDLSAELPAIDPTSINQELLNMDFDTFQRRRNELAKEKNVTKSSETIFKPMSSLVKLYELGENFEEIIDKKINYLIKFHIEKMKDYKNQIKHNISSSDRENIERFINELLTDLSIREYNEENNN